MDEATDPDLIVAVLRGDLRAAERILASGADINEREGLSLVKTPLMFAAAVGNVKIANLLLSYGADVALNDSYGREALMHAKGVAVTARLLAAGADVNAVDENGRTALMRAVEQCDDKRIVVLHRAGADVNARDNGDDTALTIAINWGLIAIRALLRTLGATE